MLGNKTDIMDNITVQVLCTFSEFEVFSVFAKYSNILMFCIRFMRVQDRDLNSSRTVI